MKRVLTIECPYNDIRSFHDLTDWTSLPVRPLKVEAVKSIRTLTGWGLKEAKDFVETRQVTQITVQNSVSDAVLNDCIRALEGYGMKVTNMIGVLTCTVHQALEEAVKARDYQAVVELAQFLAKRA